MRCPRRGRAVSAFRRPAAQTVDEIVAKNLEAKGGVQKLRETNTVRLTGDDPAGARGARHDVETADPSAAKWISRAEDGAGVRRHHHVDRRPGMPAQEMPPGPADRVAQAHVEFDSQFLDWQQKGHKIEYKGKVTEAGKEFHHLVFMPKEGPLMILPRPGDRPGGKDGDEIEEPAVKGKMETRFTDYRNIDGRMIPFVMTQS